MDDNDDDVRLKSIIALGNIGNSAVEPLLKVLETGDWKVKSMVAEVLGKIGDKRAVKPLLKLLYNKNQNKYVRGHIIEVLGKIGDERAIEPLIKALDDKYIYVRLKAKNALDTIKPKGTGSWIVHYENEEISFDYPHIWDVNETTNNKKIIKGGVASNTITFSINRLKDADDIEIKEFSDILKNVFITPNKKIISEKEFKTKDMDTIILMGESIHIEPLTTLKIVAYKKKDLLYHLWFTGEQESFEIFKDDINLITNSVL